MTFKERLFLALAARPSWIRYLITLLVILCIVGIWWLVSFRQLLEQQKRIEQHIQEHVQQQEHKAHIAQKQASAQLSLQNREELNRKAWQAFFACPHATAFVEQLVTVAQEHHIQLYSYHLSEPQKEPWGSHVELSCDLSGDFFSLISLFEQCEALTNSMMLSCDVQPLSDGQVRCSCRFALQCNT